jgi:hypothetical protein
MSTFLLNQLTHERADQAAVMSVPVEGVARHMKRGRPPCVSNLVD